MPLPPQAVARGAVVIVTDREPDARPGRAGDRRRRRARRLCPRRRPAVRAAAARSRWRSPAPTARSSIASFVRQIWAASGIPAASLGTLGVETAPGLGHGSLTTPDPLSLHRDLGALDGRGHRPRGDGGLEPRARSAPARRRAVSRRWPSPISAATISTITATWTTYRDAKLRLFTRPARRWRRGGRQRRRSRAHAVHVRRARSRRDADDRWAARARGSRSARSPTRASASASTGRLVGETGQLPPAADRRIPGQQRARGARPRHGDRRADKSKALAALETLKGAKGRLELVGRAQRRAIFVDYSHKPDALKNALTSLRPYAKGKLTVVFGCGGDRDKGKRPMMGADRQRAGRPGDRHRRQPAHRGCRDDPLRDHGRGARAPRRSATAARRSHRP